MWVASFVARAGERVVPLPTRDAAGGEGTPVGVVDDVAPRAAPCHAARPSDSEVQAEGITTRDHIASRFMVEAKRALVVLSDEVWQRLRGRFDGLSDAEYLWEAAPGCWTIRPRVDGRWRADSSVPRPEPAPFTTIAWRLWHLIDMYGEDRAPEWLDVARQGDPIGLDDPQGEPPSTAAEALVLLDRAHDRWDAHLALASEGSLGETIGPVGGAYADRSRVAYVLHMLDEFIHHGAEIALLRDLWRWQHPLGVDANTERAMRGDLALADEVDDLDARSATDLMGVAAEYARWQLVAALVRAGTAIPAGARTPLHLAAAGGELEVVQLLVERGADTTAPDPEFHAPPIEWARFLHQHHVVAWLEAHAHD